MNKSTRKTERVNLLGNCIGGVVIALLWAFFLGKDWPTAIVSGVAWAIASTLTQVVISRLKERKQERVEAPH